MPLQPNAQLVDCENQSRLPLREIEMTESDIIELLKERYSGNPQKQREWAFFEKLRIGTGYGPDADQEIDAWVMNLYPGKNFVRMAFEIKVSRSDFLSELRNPLKRRRALLLSNMFYFVAPAGVIKPEELPLECGLLEIVEYPQTGIKAINTVVSAVHRDNPPPSWRFFASIARRIFREENNA